MGGHVGFFEACYVVELGSENGKPYIIFTGVLDCERFGFKRGVVRCQQGFGNRFSPVDAVCRQIGLHEVLVAVFVICHIEGHGFTSLGNQFRSDEFIVPVFVLGA